MACQLLGLSIEALEPPRLATFWGDLLGWELTEDPSEGLVLLPGETTDFRLRFFPAEEGRSGQDQRHLHLTSTSIEDQQETVAKSLGLGARHVDVGQRPEEGHVVLADPEGNEFCIIEPGNKWLAGCGFLAELTCDGSPEVGYFWSEALGWPLVLDEGLQTAVRSPEGGPKVSWDAERLLPESVKTRLHLDLVPLGHQREERDRLVSLGASLVDDQGAGSWLAMADPDGRQFYLLAPG